MVLPRAPSPFLCQLCSVVGPLWTSNQPISPCLAELPCGKPCGKPVGSLWIAEGGERPGPPRRRCFRRIRGGGCKESRSRPLARSRGSGRPQRFRFAPPCGSPLEPPSPHPPPQGSPRGAPLGGGSARWQGPRQRRSRPARVAAPHSAGFGALAQARPRLRTRPGPARPAGRAPARPSGRPGAPARRTPPPGHPGPIRPALRHRGPGRTGEELQRTWRGLHNASGRAGRAGPASSPRPERRKSR